MKAVSLCSGIGGLDIPFLEEGIELALAIDLDKTCVASYQKNVSRNVLCSDIRRSMKDIPDHDILLVSPPCQSWSVLGNLKGFDDPRGRVFFDILDICRVKSPSILVMENVANIVKYSKGEAFRYMTRCLQVIGYRVYYDILDSQDFGVPQRRKRVFVVAVHRDRFRDRPFYFPKGEMRTVCLRDILEETVDSKYFLNPKTKAYVLDVPSNRGGKSSPPIDQDVAKTILTAAGVNKKCTKNNYVTDDKNALDPTKSNLRRLTPTECLRLQGFNTDCWTMVGSDTQIYKQAGNAVTVTVARALVKQLIDYNEKNYLCQR